MSRNEAAARIGERNEATEIIGRIATATDAEMERLFHLGYAEAYVAYDGRVHTAFRLNEAGQALWRGSDEQSVDESLDGNLLPF